jgi:DNA-binding phage protein
MHWNCTLTEERLSDFLEGALLPEEAAALSAHAAGCPNCAKLVAQVSGLVSRMQDVPQVAEPAQLQRKILDATLGPRKQKPAAQGWFGWLPLIWQPRFAMGIVTVAASFVIVFHAASASASRTSMNPVNLVRGANRQVHLTYARGAKFVNDLRVVYEIQSRLSSQPESMSEPISVPATRPSGEPQPGQIPSQPSNDPREKSQTIPHSSRRSAHSIPELAMILPTGFPTSSSNDVFRSSL